MNKFKFDIGDLVFPKAAKYKANRFIIIARFVLESNGVDESVILENVYRCRSGETGMITDMSEMEIIIDEGKDKPCQTA